MSKEVTHYKVCSEEKLASLEDAVNQSIGEGFQPIGNFVVTSTDLQEGKLPGLRYYQPMVKICEMGDH
jgi:hypothetical protein